MERGMVWNGKGNGMEWNGNSGWSATHIVSTELTKSKITGP